MSLECLRDFLSIPRNLTEDRLTVSSRWEVSGVSICTEDVEPLGDISTLTGLLKEIGWVIAMLSSFLASCEGRPATTASTSGEEAEMCTPIMTTGNSQDDYHNLAVISQPHYLALTDTVRHS